MKQIHYLLRLLYTHKYIGARHIPEKKLLRFLPWFNKQIKKEFEKEYRNLAEKKFILRTKKQTGKGTGWHVSLNPKKVKNVEEMLKW